MMGTGFKRDIGSGAARGTPGLRQRHGLCVGPATGLSPAAPYDTPVPDDHTTDRRIGGSAAQRTLRQPQRVAHMHKIVSSGFAQS